MKRAMKTRTDGNAAVAAAPEAITHDEEHRRFELTVSGMQSVIDYEYFDGVINVTRVYVPYELAGQGLASRMARYVLNYARENGLKVIPTCSFIKVYIQRHPEFQDLLTRFGNLMNYSRRVYSYE